MQVESNALVLPQLMLPLHPCPSVEPDTRCVSLGDRGLITYITLGGGRYFFYQYHLSPCESTRLLTSTAWRNVEINECFTYTWRYLCIQCAIVAVPISLWWLKILWPSLWPSFPVNFRSRMKLTITIRWIIMQDSVCFYIDWNTALELDR